MSEAAPTVIGKTAEFFDAGATGALVGAGSEGGDFSGEHPRGRTSAITESEILFLRIFAKKILADA